MKICLPALLMMALLACNTGGKKADADKDSSAITSPDTTANDQVAAKDPITDSLMKLPFIIKSNNYIDSVTGHKNGIAFMTDTTDAVISVRAGYNGPERFETYYDFIINRETGEIEIMHLVTGDYIPLKEFLKNNQ